MGSAAPAPPPPDALLPAGRQPPPPLVAFGQEAVTGRSRDRAGRGPGRLPRFARSFPPSGRPHLRAPEQGQQDQQGTGHPPPPPPRRPLLPHGGRAGAGAGPQRGRAALPWQPRDRPPSRHRAAQGGRGDSFPSAASPGLGLPAAVPAPSRAAAAQRRDREGAAVPRGGGQRFGAAPGSCKNRERGSNFRHFYAGIVDYDRHGMGPSTHRCDVIGARRQRGRTGGAGYPVGGSGLCAAPSLPGPLRAAAPLSPAAARKRFGL